MQREGALKLKRRGGVVEYGEEDNTSVDIGVAAPTVKGVLRYGRAHERRQQKEKERESGTVVDLQLRCPKEKGMRNPERCSRNHSSCLCIICM